jgi:ADP-L-glycero-D-manno-heptose 6-epimerase
VFKHILITGGAGFIGSNLALALQDKYPDAEMSVIDDFRSGSFKNLEGFRGDVIAADLTDLDLSYYFDNREPDAVFHLASITDTTDHRQFEQTRYNVESWRNVLAYFAEENARIVWASSAATYGIAGGINTLDQPRKPANIYAFSKVQMENLAHRHARENPGEHLVGLRYFNVYGPRETHKGVPSSMIYQLAQQMLKGERPRIFEHGEQKRDFVYVNDIVNYTIAAAENKSASEDGKAAIYNAGSGQARSFNDVVTNLNRVLKTNLEPEYIVNPYPFYQPHTEADLQETKARLGVSPEYSLEEGIDDYFASGWLTNEPAA